MSRTRDSHRSKVYDAERSVFVFGDVQPHYPETQLDGTHKSAQMFLDRVSRSALFRDLAPRVQGQRFGKKPYTPRLLVSPDYQGRTRSHAGNTYSTYRGRWRPEVNIAKPHLGLRWLLLHEASHWCVPRNAAWHGPEFCFAYHQLVGRFIGPDVATRLYDALDERGLEAAA